MTCSGTGGFILSGIKVQVADGKPLGAQLAAAGGSGTEAAGRGGGGGQVCERVCWRRGPGT